jgi:hypothetical protein
MKTKDALVSVHDRVPSMKIWRTTAQSGIKMKASKSHNKQRPTFSFDMSSLVGAWIF